MRYNGTLKSLCDIQFWIEDRFYINPDLSLLLPDTKKTTGRRLIRVGDWITYRNNDDYLVLDPRAFEAIYIKEPTEAPF